MAWASSMYAQLLVPHMILINSFAYKAVTHAFLDKMSQVDNRELFKAGTLDIGGGHSRTS